MKIKLIALAVAALVSGVANAAIDSGSVTGNGNLLFTAWDNNSSYTLNTGYTVDSFNAAVAAGTNLSFSTALLSSFMSTAAADTHWTIFAGDVKVPFRSVTTTDGSNTGTLNNATAKLVDANNAAWIDANLNAAGAPFAAAGVTEAISLSTTAAYTGNSSLAFGVTGYILNFNSNATLANDSYANGLNVISVNAAGSTSAAFSVYSPYAVAGTPVHAWLAADKSFNIGTVAAVPEADSLAMLLAGMGLVGSIARRRARKTA